MENLRARLEAAVSYRSCQLPLLNNTTSTLPDPNQRRKEFLQIINALTRPLIDFL
jgi:hypothetical protein